jgi:hypothetical protein
MLKLLSLFWLEKQVQSLDIRVRFFYWSAGLTVCQKGQTNTFGPSSSFLLFELCADKLSLTRQNTDLVFSFRIGRAYYEIATLSASKWVSLDLLAWLRQLLSFLPSEVGLDDLCEKGDSGFWRLFFFFLLSFIAGCCF